MADENVDLRTEGEAAGDPDVDATPRATTPITPFGDAKPWAGSILSVDAEDGEVATDEGGEDQSGRTAG